MTTLVVGASGTTGKQLVAQLLGMGQKVKVIVRSLKHIPEDWKDNPQVSIINASVLDISEEDMSNYLKNCEAIASCLGHNLTLKGMFGQPKKLVRDAVALLCNASKKNAPPKPIKFVLMNTAGNSNRDLNETISFGEKLILGLIRFLLPPHSDNEAAADYLRVDIGQKDALIEWVAVRPDTLINNDEVTTYTLHPSPTRSAIFNPGKTSRINVGHVMAKLITDDDLWLKWKGQMPIIYNEDV